MGIEGKPITELTDEDLENIEKRKQEIRKYRKNILIKNWAIQSWEEIWIWEKMYTIHHIGALTEKGFNQIYNQQIKIKNDKT